MPVMNVRAGAVMLSAFFRFNTLIPYPVKSSTCKVSIFCIMGVVAMTSPCPVLVNRNIIQIPKIPNTATPKKLPFIISHCMSYVDCMC
ncbi:hypothetical protein NMT12_20046 [metagenome]